jgi:hypothetical protein
MIVTEGSPSNIAVTAQVVNATQVEQKQEEKRTTAADVLETIADGIDGLGLAADGCKAIGKAIQPSHITGGKDTLAGFTTGGGDDIADGFQTVADCTPVADAPEAVAETAGLVADAAGMIGDVLSRTAEVIGGIIGGIADGL